MSNPPAPGGLPDGAPTLAQQERGRAAARSTVALLVSRAVVSLLGWAGSVVVARMLSPQDWGHWSFVFGLLGLLAVVTDLGVGRVVVARLVQDDDPVDGRLLASSFLALRTALGVLGYVAAMGYVLLVPHPDAVVRATAVAGVVVLIATPSHALTVLFQSRLRLTVVALAEAIGQLVQLVLVVVVALLAPSLLLFVVPVLVNELVKLGLKVRAVRRDERLRPARQIELWRWRPMLVEAVPLALGTATATLLHKIDVVMLSRLDTFTAVGIYSVGYKFADVLVLVASAVLGPALTLLVAAWPHDPVELRRRTRAASLLLGGLGALAVAAFWTAASPVVVLLYGPRFADAAFPSQMLVVGACLSMLSNVGVTVLVATGRARLYPLIGLAALALNVALNMVLIPRLSYDGAALATVVAEIAVLVLVWSAVTRSVPVRGLLPVGRLAVLLVATAAVVVLGGVLADGLAWPLQVMLSASVIAALCLAVDVPGARLLSALILGRTRR